MQSKNRLTSVIVNSLMLVSIGLVAILGAPATIIANAAGRLPIADPPGPDRYTSTVINYTAYEWWLIGWESNTVVCQVFIDHEEMPTPKEIYQNCGQKIYDTWSKTSACSSIGNCTGYYLLFAGSAPAKRTVSMTLPAPSVWISLEDCGLDALGRCSSPPTLVLTGEEPIKSERITRIEGYVDGEDFSCSGQVCKFALNPTSMDGAYLEFWAYSSYGDSSDRLTAKVRVVEDASGGKQGWYVDVLSSQWVGAPVASCSLTWDAFPPVGGPPEWLTTPEDSTFLQTDIPYAYLAGHLIKNGAVNAKMCPNGGLMPNGSATPCGVDMARELVMEWQNQFDSMIFNVADETQVPAHLIKNLFSRESQFWPGEFPGEKGVGLGQLTENGADVTLLWNPTFYNKFCPQILNTEVCAKPYSRLTVQQQAALRGAMVSRVDTDCETCALNIDLDRATTSIEFFAETVKANCAQMGNIIRNVYGRTPGEVASYTDLWMFTLANYNAGSGCTYQAIKRVYQNGEALNWESVSKQLSTNCKDAKSYAEYLTR